MYIFEHWNGHLSHLVYKTHKQIGYVSIIYIWKNENVSFFPHFFIQRTPCLKRLLRTSIVKNTFCLCINYKFGKIRGKYSTVQKKNDFFCITIFFWYCVFHTEQRSHVSLSARLNFAARFAFVYCKMRTKINHAQVLIWVTLPESEEWRFL